MTNKLKLVVLTSCAFLLGCAGIVYDGGYAYRDGWRPGTIKAIGGGIEYREKLAEGCSSQNNHGTYATVRYTGGSHLRSRTIPVEPNSSLQVGDRVYINIKDCNLSLVTKPE